MKLSQTAKAKYEGFLKNFFEQYFLKNPGNGTKTLTSDKMRLFEDGSGELEFEIDGKRITYPLSKEDIIG